MKGKTREENRQLYLSRINDLIESGLSQREWCGKKGIPTSMLRYWIRILRDPETSEVSPAWLKVNMTTNSSIAELQAPAEPSNVKNFICVRYSDFTVELPESCSAQRIFEVLKVLKAL